MSDPVETAVRVYHRDPEMRVEPDQRAAMQDAILAHEAAGPRGHPRFRAAIDEATTALGGNVRVRAAVAGLFARTLLSATARRLGLGFAKLQEETSWTWATEADFDYTALAATKELRHMGATSPTVVHSARWGDTRLAIRPSTRSYLAYMESNDFYLLLGVAGWRSEARWDVAMSVDALVCAPRQSWRPTAAVVHSEVEALLHLKELVEGCFGVRMTTPEKAGNGA